MADEAFVPHKRALADLNLSRTSVWRAMQSQIAGFPIPLVVRRRIYWRVADLRLLDLAMASYEGRCVFETERRARLSMGPDHVSMKPLTSAL